MIHKLIATRRAEFARVHTATQYPAPAPFALIGDQSAVAKVLLRPIAQPANSNNVVPISVHLRFSRRR
jgi:hypothetical protein